MLTIELVDEKPRKIYGIKSWEGKITIGDFEEYFYMPTDSWTLDNYKQQWRKGLERIKNHDISCLITSVYKLKTVAAIEWWKLYKVNNIIYIQNQLFGGSEILNPSNHSPFDIQTCYQYIPPRRIIDEEDGRKISEWSVEVDEI